jgi:hypothetical protein
MSLVAVGATVAATFRIAVRRNPNYWEESVNRWSIRSLTLLTLLIWLGVVILGRLIAYDHVWGSWSLSPKA